MYSTNFRRDSIRNNFFQDFQCKLVLFACFLILASCSISAQTTETSALFRMVPTQEAKNSFNRKSANERDIRHYLQDDGYRVLRLEAVSLREFLQSTPLESETAFKESGAILSLPLPEGGFARFHVVESPLMEAELAQKFPDIKTYLGQGIDDPTATLRFSVTMRGFEAQVLANGRSFFIEPVKLFDDLYVSYDGAARVSGNKEFACQVKNDDENLRLFDIEPGYEPKPNATGGAFRRDYTIAVAATGEYTQDNGGTVASGAAAVMASITRVTGIFERDVNIRLILAANNDLLIYTNPATDPYSDNGGSGNLGTMQGENQNNLDSVIGFPNYDIGHLFARTGGGLATFRSTCAPNKAMGVSGKDVPYSYTDAIYAHEIGHQFDARHTFSATTGACGNDGQITPTSAYEFGSGTTIMGYTGFCSPFDPQPFRDEYFHNVNLNQIDDFARESAGGNPCSTHVVSGNSIPTVNAGSDYTIPRLTPFTLTGSATDADGDALTYTWEQFDLGTTDQTKPLFRGFGPWDGGNTRTFPKKELILDHGNIPPATFPCPTNQNGGVCTYGEELPTVARSMNFRLTARDNRATGGSTNHDDVLIVVADTPTAFTVTAPAAGTPWTSGANELVEWNTANSENPPINAPNVKITMSIDNGANYPFILAASTANDGSEVVALPTIFADIPNARVKIEAIGNIFFDISPSFSIGRSVRISGFAKYGNNTPVIGATMTVVETGATGFTDAVGAFSIPVQGNNSYTIRASFDGHTFNPPQQTTPVVNDHFPLPETFTAVPYPLITGKITDICGGNVNSVTITANPSGATATTDPNGNYTLPVPPSGTYTITPSRSGYSFNPATRSVPIINANVPNQDFLATPPTIEYVWTGLGNNADWESSANWSSVGEGTFPGCVDYATIDAAVAINVGTRTVKRLTFSGGSLENGTLTVNERMDWFGASAANNGAFLRNADLTIPQNAELHLQGSNRKGIEAGILTNNGTIVWTGDYFNMNSTTANNVCRFDNFGTVRLESAIDHQLFLNGGFDCVFNNKSNAIISKPTGTPNLVFQQFSSFANMRLNNEGKIITGAGRLIILGSAEFKNGTRFEGAGVTLLTGGLTRKKFSGQATIANGATLETGIGGLDGFPYGGAIIEGTSAGSFGSEGTGTLLVGSDTSFDGTINLNGKTEIIITTAASNPGVNFEISNNGFETINNNGTIKWFGNTLYLSSSVFNNYGTFDILGDNILASQSSDPNVGSVFNNFPSGTIRKSNTTGATNFMNYPLPSQFKNNGLVEVQSGTFIFNAGISAGRFKTSAGAVIEGYGGHTFQGAYFDTAGTAKMTNGTFNGSFRGLLHLDGATVDAGGLTVLSPAGNLPAGTLEWKNGNFTDTNLIIQPDAAFLIDASQTTFGGSFTGATVTNNGTVQWTGQENTSIGVGAGANNVGLIFNNNGTVFLQSDGTLFRHGDNSDFVFNNNPNGVFKKSNGNGSTKLDVFGHHFNNFGTIEISSGIIEGGGVEFEFKNNSRIKSGGGRLSLGTSEAQGTITLEGSGDPNQFVLELGGDSGGVTLEGNGASLVSQNNAGFLWTGGTIKGNLLLGSGLRTTIQSSGTTTNITLDGSLSNAGTLVWENGMDWNIGSLTGGNSTFTNLSGAIFNHRTNGNITNNSGFTMNFVNAGTLNIGQSTGTFNVGGTSAVNFTNQPTGIINMDIGGAADFDRLSMPSLINLGGRLHINLVNAFVPNIGDQFKLFEGQATGTSREGSFAQVSLPSVGGKSLRLVYNNDDLTLQTDQIYLWTGAADTDWNNAANWQGNQVPPANALVEISASATNQPDLGSANTTVGNLTIEEGQTVSLGDGQTLTVNGVLNLDGNINTTGTSLQRNNLQSAIQNPQSGGLVVVGANGAINPNGGFVIGKVKKIFAGASSFTFPVGTMNGYSPVDTTITNGAGDLTVSATQTAHPNLPIANQRLQRFWTIDETGSLTANLKFNYLDADILGTESGYRLYKVENSNAMPQMSAVIDTDANTAEIIGVSAFSDWSLGALAPLSATVPVSGRVTFADGRGIAKAQISITDGNGVSRIVQTNAFGYFSFANVLIGETYTFNIAHKRYIFANPTRVLTINEAQDDINFIAN